MKWLCFLMVRVTQMEGKPGHVWQQPWQSPGTGQVTSRVVVTAIIQAPKGGWRTCLLSSLSTPRVWGSLHCDFKVFSSCLNSLFFWIIYLQTYKEMVNTTKNYQKRCPCWVILLHVCVCLQNRKFLLSRFSNISVADVSQTTCLVTIKLHTHTHTEKSQRNGSSVASSTVSNTTEQP